MFFKQGVNMTDKELIKKLGGVTAVANFLKISPQRVGNWGRRKIPAQIKLDNPEIFLSKNPKSLKETQA